MLTKSGGKFSWRSMEGTASPTAIFNALVREKAGTGAKAPVEARPARKRPATNFIVKQKDMSIFL